MKIIQSDERTYESKHLTERIIKKMEISWIFVIFVVCFLIPLKRITLYKVVRYDT